MTVAMPPVAGVRTGIECENVGLLTELKLQPADPLLSLIGMYDADPRPTKIDIGVGVYRNDHGHTPVLRAVKAAEERLVAEQASKSYLGPEGDRAYFELLIPIIFGTGVDRPRLIGLQTPGGTGALRLAAELIAAGRPDAHVWMGEPTWANHPPIFAAAGISAQYYRGFDLATQSLCFEEMMTTLEQARPGDVVLLHGCCHNPTGADFDPDQWRALAQLCAAQGLLPLIDLAYQGLGDGLEHDVAGARMVLEEVGEGLLAYSCDKNFGLYRERVGALYVLSPSAQASAVAQSNLLAFARASWSMPPDHGAAIVRTILSDPALTADWRVELDAMRERLTALRQRVAEASLDLAAIAGQRGLFSMLHLNRDQIRRLREDNGVYLAGSGRINVAGLRKETIGDFVAAVAAVR